MTLEELEDQMDLRGTRGPKGPNVPKGPKGPNVPNGPNGPKGPNGHKGPNGPKRPNRPKGPTIKLFFVSLKYFLTKFDEFGFHISPKAQCIFWPIFVRLGVKKIRVIKIKRLIF
jgi:hypothetical protein